jgi:hypothetical protein
MVGDAMRCYALLGSGASEYGARKLGSERRERGVGSSPRRVAYGGTNEQLKSNYV